MPTPVNKSLDGGLIGLSEMNLLQSCSHASYLSSLKEYAERKSHYEF